MRLVQQLHWRLVLIACSGCIAGAAADAVAMALPAEFRYIELVPVSDTQVPRAAPAGTTAADMILMPVDAPSIAVQDSSEEDDGIGVLDTVLSRVFVAPGAGDHRPIEDSILLRLLSGAGAGSTRLLETPPPLGFTGRTLKSAVEPGLSGAGAGSTRLLETPPPLGFTGRTLKSAVEPGLRGDEEQEHQLEPGPGDPMESRVLDALPAHWEAARGGDERSYRQRRSALNVIIKRGVEAEGDAAEQQQRAGESSPAPPPPGGFLETIQGQLPGQLQGLGGAMENSEMVVGTFQAIIMPGSAATDLGQQIQGFISNMPQIPGAGG